MIFDIKYFQTKLYDIMLFICFRLITYYQTPPPLFILYCVHIHMKKEQLKVIILSWFQWLKIHQIFLNDVWTLNTGYGSTLSRLVCSIKVYNHQMNLETKRSPRQTECLVHVSRPPPYLTRQHRRTHKHSTDDHKEQIQAGSFPPPCDLDMHAHCCS